jgi:hypothetical protein
MHTYTFICQAISVVMLPCRKHDVQLRDKHVLVFPPLFWRKSEQPCPDQFVAGCDCGGMCWRLLEVCKTSVVGDLSPVDNLMRLHGLGAIGLDPYFRGAYTNGSFSLTFM